MASILGIKTIKSTWVFQSDVDPTIAPTTAPIGSFGGAKDGSGLFYKYGITNTDWVGLIPYTGASNDVNLGTHSLIVANIKDSLDTLSIDIENRLGVDSTGSEAFRWGDGDVNIDNNLIADGGFIRGSSYHSADDSAGVSTTITTASLVGKTITVKNGLITDFS